MAGNHKIGHTEKKETDMFPSGLAKIFLDRMRVNDLDGFEKRLTHFLAVEALNGNDGLVFHKACDHSNIEFVRGTAAHISLIYPKKILKNKTF